MYIQGGSPGLQISFAGKSFYIFLLGRCKVYDMMIMDVPAPPFTDFPEKYAFFLSKKSASRTFHDFLSIVEHACSHNGRKCPKHVCA